VVNQPKRAEPLLTRMVLPSTWGWLLLGCAVGGLAGAVVQ
jgi:hypothetical protein